MGRLVRTKGIRLLPKPVRFCGKRNDPSKLLVIGDGPERASLETIVREWQLTSHVQFLGRLKQSQTSEVLSKGDRCRCSLFRWRSIRLSLRLCSMEFGCLHLI